jgi:hypothetical protein
VFDPASGAVIHKQHVFKGSITKMLTGADGFIYCRTEKSIIRFKPLSGKLKWISFETLFNSDRKGRGLASGLDGRIYFGNGTELRVLEGL